MLMGEPLLLMGQVVSSLKTRRAGMKKHLASSRLLREVDYFY